MCHETKEAIFIASVPIKCDCCDLGRAGKHCVLLNGNLPTVLDKFYSPLVMNVDEEKEKEQK